MRAICDQRTLQRAGAHARERFPGECCGLLVGHRGCVAPVSRDSASAVWRVADYIPLTNTAPLDRAFVVDPIDFARAEARARQRGLALCGFLHSHPNGAAVPSRADRQHAWPGYLQVIYPVHRGIPGTPRGWFFHEGELSPIDLETPAVRFTEFSLKRDPNCPACGGVATARQDGASS